MAQDPIGKFWMVWGVQRSMPRHQHNSKISARREAERLSRDAPGELFVVLSVVDAVISPVMDPQTVKLIKPDFREVDDDIPF